LQQKRASDLRPTRCISASVDICAVIGRREPEMTIDGASERKHVTVLFADVRGSMALAEQLDVEDWRAIIDRFFVLLADGVHRFGGTVIQYTGDGVMAVFGAPVAYEDHAQRACAAALHLRDELRRHAQTLRRERGVRLRGPDGLQTAAVVGREFGAGLLERVVELAADELAPALHALVAAGLVHAHSLYPEARYAFKHPLTQEVAYASMLRTRRAPVHARVARSLAADAGDLDELAADVAHHWEAGGDVLEAARWHRRAAEWARNADVTAALRHWRRVRTLVRGLPETPETLALGLLASVRILSMGWIAGIAPDEAAELLADGRTLAERGGDTSTVPLLVAVYQVAGMRGDASTRTLPFAATAVRAADQSGDDAVRSVVRMSLVAGLFEAGRLAEALAEAEHALAVLPPEPGLGADLAGVSPYIWFTMFRGLLLGVMGRLREATGHLERAAALARAHDDVELVAQTFWCRSALAYVAGDATESLAYARQAVEIAERIGSALARVFAYQALAQAEMLAGDVAAAFAAAEHALATARASHTARQTEPESLALLAAAQAARGPARAARDTASRARSRWRTSAARAWRSARRSSRSRRRSSRRTVRRRWARSRPRSPAPRASSSRPARVATRPSFTSRARGWPS
jgi:class 3 adenylate cyclase